MWHPNCMNTDFSSFQNMYKKNFPYKSAFLFLFFLTATGSLLAVNPSDSDSGIKGKVVDKISKTALEYATVMVYQLPDSTFVSGGITDKHGSFEMKLKAGRYYLTVQFLAYGTVTLHDIQIGKSRNVLDLGELLIAPDDAMLNEVEVVAEKSTVEMTLDKRVFNIGKDISSTAGNAIEVLENIPSVTVDVEGNVSLRGDEGVRILIDGKVSGLAGINSRDALRSLQADMIDRIEVVTNPSVRYSAEGTAGIINIVLKKDRRMGFNGSIDLNTGFPWQYGIGLNTNYRLKKINFFANYAFNYRERIGTGEYYREFYREDGTYKTYQNTDRNRTGYSNTIRFGAEYFLSPQDVLTLSLMYRYSDEKNSANVKYRDFGPFDVDLGGSERIDNETENDPNLEYAISYKKDFKRKDQQLTANIQYFNNTETENSSITENFFNATAPSFIDFQEFQKIANNEKERNLQAQADYVHPFRGKAKFETGIKYEQRDIGNNYEVRDKDENGSFILLPEFSNHFDYTEKIAAAYALFGNDAGRYSYQLGLRAEYSEISTLLRETAENNNNDYLDFFPSIHFNYKLSEKDQLQLSYSRRIRRPDFRHLNPFRSFSDNRNIWSGNPNLKPIYTDSYEFGYLHYWKNASLNFNTYYRYSVNVFQRIERVDSSGISYTRPENFAKDDSYGLELIGNATPVKLWNISGNINFFRSMTNGEANGIVYNTDYYTITGRINNKFNIQKGFDIQLSTNYMGPMDTPQGIRRASWTMDLGASKDLLKNKATLSLSVRDIFGTRRYSFETFGDTFYSDSEFRWGSTTLTLNFNYRINQQKKKSEGQRNGQSMDEGGGIEF